MNNKRLTENERKGYALFLNQTSWDFYCTFTTEYKLTLKTARKLMERLKSHLGEKYIGVKIAWVTEPFNLSKGHHVHALVLCQSKDNKTKFFIQKAWKNVSGAKSGYRSNGVDISVYDKNLGANFYILKFINQDHVDYELF